MQGKVEKRTKPSEMRRDNTTCVIALARDCVSLKNLESQVAHFLFLDKRQLSEIKIIYSQSQTIWTIRRPFSRGTEIIEAGQGRFILHYVDRGVDDFNGC
jgi:hypothetical protein